LTVLDEYTRQGLAIECQRHLTSGDIIQVLQRLVARHGPPQCLKSDNGPEFIAKAVQQWLAETGIQTRYIEPGSPWQNGHPESFHAVLRDSCLNRWLFLTLREAQEVIAAWLAEYNTERPHGALNDLAPARFAARYAASKAWNTESNNATTTVHP
jgi:transposase InsO family protein